MGYSPFYQIIPPESGLFRLLKSYRKAERMLAYLFHHGSRPLDLREDEAAPDRDGLGHLVKWSPLLESIEEAKETLATLSDEVDRACEDHPRPMDRVAFVEKTLDQIERRLDERLEIEVLYTAKPPGGWVFGSDDRFATRDDVLSDKAFGVVSPSRVRVVAAVLEGVEAESLFDEHENHLRDDFQELKNLYREAANRCEAILVC